MIKCIIMAFFNLQSTISLCQLARVDQFGIVSKLNQPLKINSVINKHQPLIEQQPDKSLQDHTSEPAVIVVRLCKPLKNLVPTSGYGRRIHPITGVYQYHTGIDYKAFYEPVYNIADGKVIKAGYNEISGNYMVIEHGLVSSVYCHLQELYYTIGDFVPGGEMIAKSGNTGRSTGPHLHFGLKYNKKDINPGLLSTISKFNNN